MKCWRVYKRRTFMRYLDGQLDRRSSARFEDHLLDCGWCRGHLARLREGQRFARHIPSPRPAPDRWDEIEAALEDQPSSKGQSAKKPILKRPATAAIALLTAAMLIIFYSLPSEPSGMNEYDLEKFQAVNLVDLPRNTMPHIVTEGYVSELRLEADGDMVFRLVEDINQPDPFIVCEIIRPINVPPPAVGSRVRVYGVSRYDGQPDRQWYEVHPVLNIEVVRR